MLDYSESTNCVDCKKSSKCFQKLIPSELEFINHNKTQIKYLKGENICKQSAFASYVQYIADGLVKIYIEDQRNKNINVRISRSSEFIGLSAIFGDNIYNYSAIALKDSTICLIEKDSFKKLLIDNGMFASEIIRWHCEKEKQLFEKIKSLGNKQMHGRLASTLLYLCGDDFREDDLFASLTRKDIADFACISTEGTVRLLTELKNDKIIDIQGKRIEILNKETLKQISIRG
jgi:CRP/FNR family transcriptional regulator